MYTNKWSILWKGCFAKQAHYTILYLILLMPNLAHGQIIADLKSDWSDTNNPNGPWAYRQGTTLLPHVADLTALGASVTQPAWATGASSAPFLPFILKATSNPAPATFDWQVGDIVLHTTDPFNGGSFGVVNITWTSTLTGVVNFSGGVWLGRDALGRSNHWEMFRNGSLLTSGDITSSDPYNRSSPFDFSFGTGGASALQNLSVTIGDVFELRETRTNATGGEFSGVNWSISAVNAVPEPSSILMLGSVAVVGGIGAIRYRRKKCLVRSR